VFAIDVHERQKVQAVTSCCAKRAVTDQSLFFLSLHWPGFPRWRRIHVFCSVLFSKFLLYWLHNSQDLVFLFKGTSFPFQRNIISISLS